MDEETNKKLMIAGIIIILILVIILTIDRLYTNLMILETIRQLPAEFVRNYL